MRTKFFAGIVVSIMLTILISSCYYDKEDLLYPTSSATTSDCSATPAKFSADVSPIIASKCATSGCHNRASAAGGVTLETYTEIAGKSSRINQRVVVEKSMPPSGPLSTAELAKIKCWIASGTPND